MYVVMKQGRKEDAVLFAELHRRMSSQGVWHNGWAILHLLLVLSDEHAASPAHSIVRNLCMCVRMYVQMCVHVYYCIAQNFDGEKSDKFDECVLNRQNFPYQNFAL